MKHLSLALATLGILAAMPASAEEQRINVGVAELTCPTGKGGWTPGCAG